MNYFVADEQLTNDTVAMILQVNERYIQQTSLSRWCFQRKLIDTLLREFFGGEKIVLSN